MADGCLAQRNLPRVASPQCNPSSMIRRNTSSIPAGVPNWQNRTLFHGDNLLFLRAINSESVDLIATDPPFNKGRDFHATPSSLAAGAKFQDRWSWARDVHQEWTDQITDDHPRLMEAIESARYAHSDGMGAYMCFMAVRLLEMRRVLRPTGSIFLHCDPTASHYLKAIMDAIFGCQMFINEIVWHYDGPQRPSRRRFGSKHDIIFRYGKTADYFSDPDGVAPFQPLDEAGLRPYKRLPDGRYFYTTPRGDYTDTSIARLTAENRVEHTKRGTVRIRHFLPVDNLGRVGRAKQLPDVWSDIVSLGHAGGAERVGYPTQKPLALYERMLCAGSKENDIVLDPFAGCATTLVAAERLQRQWIGMDIWEGAHQLVKQRLSETTGLFGSVTFTDKPPERTDDGGQAAPFLQVRERINEPDGPRWTRGEMYAHLLAQNGPHCMGCDRNFDDPRYLELDHNTPRSDGGLNHISNRILLCGPCNRLKSNTYTLSGLRRENRKRGFMANKFC